MSLAFQNLTINGSGQISIPVDNNTTRTGKGSALTWAELESTHRDAMVRNFNVLPNSGNADTLVQILGGHNGSQVMLRPDTGSTITLVDSATLRIPTGTIELSETYHCVLLVCIGTNLYAKLI